MNSIPSATWIVIGSVALLAGLWVMYSGVSGLINVYRIGPQNGLIEYGTYALILIFGIGVAVKAIEILVTTKRKS